VDLVAGELPAVHFAALLAVQKALADRLAAELPDDLAEPVPPAVR
jgi:hypothetical protein